MRSPGPWSLLAVVVVTPLIARAPWHERFGENLAVGGTDTVHHGRCLSLGGTPGAASLSRRGDALLVTAAAPGLARFFCDNGTHVLRFQPVSSLILDIKVNDSPATTIPSGERFEVALSGRDAHGGSVEVGRCSKVVLEVPSDWEAIPPTQPVTPGCEAREFVAHGKGPATVVGRFGGLEARTTVQVKEK